MQKKDGYDEYEEGVLICWLQRLKHYINIERNHKFY